MATKAAEKTGLERTAGLDLSREAARLLRALEGGGAYAIADPVVEGTVILRQESAGVSLGGGRFPISAADELVRRDLVESSRAGAGRRFCISRVGVARRRRQTAPPDLAFPAQHQDLVQARIAFEGRSAAVTLDASESPLDLGETRQEAAEIDEEIGEIRTDGLERPDDALPRRDRGVGRGRRIARSAAGLVGDGRVPVRGHPGQHGGKRQIQAQALSGLVTGFVDERRAARILATAKPVERTFRGVERDRGAAALEGDSRTDEILVLGRESEVGGRGLPAPARNADSRDAEAPAGSGAA